MFLTKYHKEIFCGLATVFLFFIIIQTGLAIAAPTETTTNLTTTAQGGGLIKDTASAANLPTIIGKIVGAALSFLGVVFFVLIIYGGYMWMFSMGNEQTVGKAKDIIMAAVIGLVIVLLAYVITAYIGGLFTK